MTGANGSLPVRPDELPDPRDLMRRYGLRPRKSLGQHFLVDRSYVAQILGAAEVHDTDVVLEVGPGLGVLTGALASLAQRLVAVEIDPQMRDILRDVVGRRENIELIVADILQVEPGSLLGLGRENKGRVAGYKVVANLPYYITSAVLRHLLESVHRPERLVVMLQREVAQRLTAEPGDMSILAVAVQFYATPHRVATVPAHAFYPRPKVDSAVVRLDVHAAPPVDIGPDQTADFFRVVRAGFSQKRKQLRNSVSAGLGLDRRRAVAALEEAGIDPRRRAQTLTLEEWASVTRTLELESA